MHHGRTFLAYAVPPRLVVTCKPVIFVQKRNLYKDVPSNCVNDIKLDEIFIFGLLDGYKFLIPRLKLAKFESLTLQKLFSFFLAAPKDLHDSGIVQIEEYRQD